MPLFGFEKGEKRGTPIEEAASSLQTLKDKLAEFERKIRETSPGLPTDVEEIKNKIRETEEVLNGFWTRISAFIREWRKDNPFRGKLPEDLQNLVSEHDKLLDNARNWKLKFEKELGDLEMAQEE